MYIKKFKEGHVGRIFWERLYLMGITNIIRRVLSMPEYINDDLWLFRTKEEIHFVGIINRDNNTVIDIATGIVYDKDIVLSLRTMEDYEAFFWLGYTYGIIRSHEWKSVADEMPLKDGQYNVKIGDLIYVDNYKVSVGSFLLHVEFWKEID